MRPGSVTFSRLSTLGDLNCKYHNLHSSFWQNSKGIPLSISQSERSSTLIPSNWEEDVFCAIVTAIFSLRLTNCRRLNPVRRQLKSAKPAKRNGHALFTCFKACEKLIKFICCPCTCYGYSRIWDVCVPPLPYLLYVNLSFVVESSGTSSQK